MNSKILKLIEERLLIGERRYGHQNITADGRDFEKEALEEAFEETFQEATEEVTKDDTDKPTPKPEPPPNGISVLEPDPQIRETLIYDPNDTEGIYRIGDPGTRVVDQEEGPQGPGTSRWNYFDYDGLSGFMSPDNTDGGFQMYEKVNGKVTGRAKQFPGRSFANPIED